MKKETKSTLFAGLAMTAISGALNPVIQTGAKAVVDKLTHSISINDFAYALEDGLAYHFKDIEDVFYLNNNNEPDFKKNISYYNITPTECKSTIIWGGYPIQFIIRPVKEGEANRCSMKLATINTPGAIKNMKKFLKDCRSRQHVREMKDARDEVSVYATGRNLNMCRFYLKPFTKRTFENTFIPEAQEKLIKESLDKFISQRDWYKNNNIPYHFGFLLYGEPGHGKSVLAQAIADYIHAELIVFPGDAINELPKHIGTDICRDTVDPSIYRVVCIEDVDCGFAQSSFTTVWDGDEDKEVKRKVGLAEILNCLDGLQAPQNTIYVLTTNHIDKLDPALIRPGRCDIKLEIPGVTRETFIKFINYHYKRGASKNSFQDMNFDTNVTFAELQTLVMKGASIRDLCEKIDPSNIEHTSYDPQYNRLSMLKENE